MSHSSSNPDPVCPRRGWAAFRAVRRDQQGQSLVEFALVLPLLLLIMFGVVELGNALSVSLSMAAVSREGANIAARGTSPDTVLTVVLGNGSDINLADHGGAIVSRIEMTDGEALIVGQWASAGCGCTSRLAMKGKPAMGLGNLGLIDSSVHFAVEVFYNYETVTPLSRFMDSVVPDPMYEYAIF